MRKGKILIIEDEPEIREILKIHLMGMQYEVLEAPEGGKAQEILRSGNNRSEVGLVFCDIRMPKVNGIDTLDHLTREVPWIPLVIITGYADKELEDSLKERGAKEFLVKPVEKKKLMDTVDKYYSLKDKLESEVLSSID
ncbi:MAG: response regulator [Nitrospinales bacterium]